jgi:hypothetical protein
MVKIVDHSFSLYSLSSLPLPCFSAVRQRPPATWSATPDRRKAPSQSAHLSPSPLHATTAPLCTARSPNRMRASAVCRSGEPGHRPSTQWPRCRLPATSPPLPGRARPPPSPLSPIKRSARPYARA